MTISDEVKFGVIECHIVSGCPLVDLAKVLTCYLLIAFKLIGLRSGCFSHIDWVVPGLGTCGAVESLTEPF